MRWESSKACGQCRRRRDRLPDHLRGGPTLLRRKEHRVRSVRIRKGLDWPLALVRSSEPTPLGQHRTIEGWLRLGQVSPCPSPWIQARVCPWGAPVTSRGRHKAVYTPAPWRSRPVAAATPQDRTALGWVEKTADRTRSISAAGGWLCRKPLYSLKLRQIRPSIYTMVDRQPPSNRFPQDSPANAARPSGTALRPAWRIASHAGPSLHCPRQVDGPASDEGSVISSARIWSPACRVASLAA